jgi:hypothetical protein
MLGFFWNRLAPDWFSDFAFAPNEIHAQPSVLLPVPTPDADPLLGTVAKVRHFCPTEVIDNGGFDFNPA